MSAEVRPIALADGESQNHECRHGGELGPGGNILQKCAPAQSDHVDQVSTTINSSPTTCARVNVMPATERPRVPAKSRERSAHIGGRGDRERRDGAAIGHGEQHPSVEEGDADRRMPHADRHIVRRSRETWIRVQRRRRSANSEITPPRTQTSKNKPGCGSGPAMSFAVRKIEEPMMPLTSSRTESKATAREPAGARLGLRGRRRENRGQAHYPIPSPVRREIPAECHSDGR